MLTQQTLDKLYAMKLNGMADALKELIQQPHTQDLSFENESPSSSIVNGLGRRTDA